MAITRRSPTLVLGTAAELQAAAVLADGQPGYSTDANEFKIGDGATAWNSLSNNTWTAEAICDLVGQMFTGNTETGCTVTYQDADNTIDVTVP